LATLLSAPELPKVSPTAEKSGWLRVVRHTGWNVLGQLLPLMAAVVAIPVLLRTLGIERFGFLTLAWVVIGYASLFDFGLGRALTRSVSARLTAGDSGGAHAATATAMLYLAGLSVVLALLIGAFSPWLVHNVFKLSQELAPEALVAMLLLALSVPFVMLSAGYVGALTAHHRFKEINIVRMALGVLSFVAPMAVALSYPRLDLVIAAVVLVRVVANACYAWLCRQHCHYQIGFFRPDPQMRRELFNVGGWMSVSNIVSPLLSYLDRLLLAAVVPVKSVALYTTPYDLLFRTSILPYALTSTLFPKAAGVANDSEQAWRMLTVSTRALFVITFPLTLLFFCFAEHGLRLWLGEEFASGSADILRILAFGVLLNSLAQCPAMMIQASGSPRAMALLHLIELPMFVVFFWVLCSQYGVTGAAVAASVRLTLDAVAVFCLALAGMGRVPRGISKTVGWSLLSISLLGGALLVPSLAAAMAYLIAGLALFFLLVWRNLMTIGERQLVQTAWRPQT